MALQYVKVRADRIKEISLSEGTDDFALAGTGTGFNTFSTACIGGDRFDYAITHPGTSDWETGVGIYDDLTNTVIRSEITASSNNNAKVSFGAGSKQIFITVNSQSLADYDRTLVRATALSVALGY